MKKKKIKIQELTLLRLCLLTIHFNQCTISVHKCWTFMLNSIVKYCTRTVLYYEKNLIVVKKRVKVELWSKSIIKHKGA